MIVLVAMGYRPLALPPQCGGSDRVSRAVWPAALIACRARLPWRSSTTWAR